MAEFLRTSELLQRYKQGERVFHDVYLSGGGSENLRGASFPGLQIRQAEFTEVILDGAHLEQATLYMISFRACSLKRLHLNHADLREINMQNQNLEVAQLQGASLIHAQLQWTDLRGANLQGADLTAANLRGANICGADLRKAILVRTNLEEIQSDGATRWPEKSKFQGATFSQGITLPILLGQASPGKVDHSAFVVVNGITLDITKNQAREMIRKELSGRASQAEFRKRVFHAFRRKCAITGCDLDKCLEAAHIIPFCIAQREQIPELEKSSSNGILLRADLHKLFDWNLLTIDPDTRLISLDQSVQQSPLYSHLHQTSLAEPTFVSRMLDKWISNLRWRYTSYHEYLP
jgi:uncharacterized protein YjbI with pentapeptide repeats